ncbi:MAG: hypothetical protein ACFCVF_06450 [Kineosporiaceae bacterium]
MGRTRTTTRTAKTAGVLAAVTMGVVGCAGPGEGPAVQADGTVPAGTGSAARSQTLVGADYDGRFEVVATVLDDGAAGPQLCVGGVAESYPPQCGGPPVAGWDWATVDHEAASGVRWGTYRLMGTWDGETFTIAEPPVSPDPADGSTDGSTDAFTVPCDPPPGGFEVADPDRTSEADFATAAAALERRPDVGYVAVDQSGGAGSSAPATLLEPAAPPAEWVLVVTTTGDVAAVETAARELWGGPLCVAPAARTGEELRAVQDALTGGESGDGLVEEFLSVGVDVRAEQVVVTVLLATPELQDRLDSEFGAGVVRLEGALRPVD